jgi:hypothetical protein
MIKRITCAAVLLAAASAHADPRVGVELGSTISSVAGPGDRVDLGAVQLDALVDGNYFSQSLPNHAIAVEARALVPVQRFSDGWFGVAAGAAFAARSGTDPNGNVMSDHGWAIDASLHAEWQVASHLSLGFDVGVTRRMGDAAAWLFTPGPGNATAVTFFGHATGGASFTYWF